jgi:hypothetical protein
MHKTQDWTPLPPSRNAAAQQLFLVSLPLHHPPSRRTCLPLVPAKGQLQPQRLQGLSRRAAGRRAIAVRGAGCGGKQSVPSRRVCAVRGGASENNRLRLCISQDLAAAAADAAGLSRYPVAGAGGSGSAARRRMAGSQRKQQQRGAIKAVQRRRFSGRPGLAGRVSNRSLLTSDVISRGDGDSREQERTSATADRAMQTGSM